MAWEEVSMQNFLSAGRKFVLQRKRLFQLSKNWLRRYVISRLGVGTKFFCGDKDFHKNSHGDTKRIEAATSNNKQRKLYSHILNPSTIALQISKKKKAIRGREK